LPPQLNSPLIIPRPLLPPHRPIDRAHHSSATAFPFPFLSLDEVTGFLLLSCFAATTPSI
jgi:hypothetical protein